MDKDEIDNAYDEMRKLEKRLQFRKGERLSKSYMEEATRYAYLKGKIDGFMLMSDHVNNGGKKDLAYIG